MRVLVCCWSFVRSSFAVRRSSFVVRRSSLVLELVSELVSELVLWLVNTTTTGQRDNELVSSSFFVCVCVWVWVVSLRRCVVALQWIVKLCVVVPLQWVAE